MFILLPIVIIATVGGYVLYGMHDLESYTYNLKVDSRDFYPLASINATEFPVMARVYESRLIEYHIPLNLTIMTRFDLHGNVISYDATDNGALWTGKTAAVAAMHYYLAANGSAEKDAARALVHDLITGLSMQIAVPNGGLGPGFTNTVARYYAPPGERSNGNFTWMFNNDSMNFNGTGPYSDWRCRLDTSRDELGGYFLGISAMERFVKDDSYVVNLTRLIIGQLVEGFIRTNWQELNGDGTPNGVNLNPIINTAEWKLLVMKLATLAYPDNLHYKQLYTQFTVNDYGITATPFVDPSGCITAYYGYGFGHDLILALILAENDQAFLDKFIANYEKAAYPIFQGQRNAYFNAIFLAMNKLRSTPSTSYNLSLIRWDVLDELWRFNTSGWCPMDDTYGGKNRSISRSDRDPLGQNWTITNPTFTRWASDKLINGIFRLSPHYVKPLVADMMGCSDFIWGDDPFDSAGGAGRSSPTSIHESPGTSFLLPYYILRVFGYL
ncbi:MAG TPA: hypothetical protein VKM55_19370 [Candidatus Lokiarchaeia archaeon]|nr:hypothetical protein [Candidatus Lokiarchaeia archaeon]